MSHEIQHVVQVKNSYGSQPEVWEVINQETNDLEIDMFSSASHLGINPYLTNGFSHGYHLDESTFVSRDIRSDF